MTTSTGINAISQYIEAQQDKGLVFEAHHQSRAQGGRSISYKTHWGTHRNIIHPEVNRLAIQYSLWLGTQTYALNANGFWTAPHNISGNATYLWVSLRIQPPTSSEGV